MMRSRWCAVAILAGCVVAAPASGAEAIQGAVGNVLSIDAAALETVGCRVWSLSDFGVNKNQIGTIPTCLNARCPRPYQLGGGFLEPGGFICNGENTVPYANDVDNQTFYQLVDGEVWGGACNHAAFYAAQGMVARNGIVASPTGDFRQTGCPGMPSVNCFERADAFDARSTPLTNVFMGYGPIPHQIRSIGGLSPVPTVRVTAPINAQCPAGQSFLSWDNPESYVSAMKNGVASPVVGVRLYRNERSCLSCPDGSSGWTAAGDFDAASGPAGTCVPVSGPTWFALTVRLLGPHGTSEIETGKVGSAGFVGANSQCVGPEFNALRIASVSARYAGRRRVSFTFTTGFEGGIQAFYIRRGSSSSGPYERVSEEIPPRGDGSRYVYSDRVPVGLASVYYAIEILGTDGRSDQFGPAMASLPGVKTRRFGP